MEYLIYFIGILMYLNLGLAIANPPLDVFDLLMINVFGWGAIVVILFKRR